MTILGFRHRGRLLASTALVAASVAFTAPAWAQCAPAAANNATPTCTGTTHNQGNGAPGTSAGSNGYGTGAENNMTVTVVPGAGVSGTVDGIAGFNGLGGVISVSNSSVSAISGGTGSGISGYNVFVTTNTGNIDTNGIAGISAVNSATVSNSGFGFIAANAGSGIIVSAGNANVTNSGTIQGSAGNTFGIVGTSVTVMNSGTITGGNVGIFALSLGGSSVTNSGIITGAGGTAIQFAGGGGNTLTLAPGSVITGNVLGTGNDIFQLGGSGSATFDASSIGAGGQYQGFAAFNKIGASVWTLTGASALAMPWIVNAGTLDVNGTMPNATMAVNAGGTLGGSGTVGATQINAGGTFAPGMPGAPGTSMTVNGNLAFQSGAQYVVALNPATSSFATVTGAATLGGATVNAQFAAGSYVAKQYTILTAGSVSGTFNAAVANTNLPSNFQTTLSYSATHAYLNLALNFNPPPPPSPPGPPPPSPPPPTGGLNVNQQHVANALTNFFDTTGGIPMVFGALTPAGLTQASGEAATGSQQTTFNAMTQFMGLMTDPFIDGRGDCTNAGERDACTTNRSERDAYAMMTKAPPKMAPFTPGWSVWAAGFGGSQTTGGNAVLGSNTATSRIAATAVGADYRFSPNTIAGFALAGGGTNFGIANGLGGGRSDLFQAGAFVRHTVGAAYVTGALAYGWQDVTTDRTATIAGIDQLRAKFNANAYSGRAEGGYRFVAPWMGITPYAAAQFTTFELPAYAEQVIVGSNNFALAYGSKSVTDTRSELGIRTDKSFALSNAILTLRGRFAWAHDYDPDRTIAATFQTLPGATFVVNGAAQAHDSALATAAAEMKWINGWSAAATFEGEFSNVTRSYAGKGVVRYAW
jgi:uncharacterized protein with beta-barrel porin domain